MGGIESKKNDESLIPTHNNYWNKGATPPTEVVEGIRSQISEYGAYRASCSNCYGNACTAGNCSAFTSWGGCGGSSAPLRDATGQVYTPEGSDYLSRRESCFCSSPVLCSRANVTECWLGKSAKSGEEPTYRVDWDSNKRIRCTYDLERIDNVSQIEKFLTKFELYSDDPSLFKIMSKFCATQSTSCPFDPTTGANAPTCSLITGVGNKPENVMCRKWYETLSDENKDAFMDEYCINNTSSAECKCVLRASNPTYNAIKKYFSNVPEQDGCMWTPCKGGSPLFFVPSRDINPTCPSTFCQQSFNVSDVQGNVTIRDNQSYVQCAPPKILGQPGEAIVNPLKEYRPISTTKLVGDSNISATNRHRVGYIIMIAIIIIGFILINM